MVKCSVVCSCKLFFQTVQEQTDVKVEYYLRLIFYQVFYITPGCIEQYFINKYLIS